MKKTLVAIVLGTAVLITACGEEKKTPHPTPTTDPVQPEKQAVVYQYDHASTQVKWTGYKTPKKVGVQGTFDSVIVNGFTPGPDPVAAMEGVTFELVTSSTETQDSARNAKIVTYFFNTMLNTESITGSIKSLTGTAKAGKGVIALKMNDVELDLPVDYKIDNNTEVMISGTMDVAAWNAKSSLDSLTKVCYEKHEGITWPEVEVKVFTTLIQE